jgi:DNA topoisomerase VI subunit B
VTLRTQEFDGVTVYPRGVSELPPETKEIQPHPKGIELGTLLQMLKDYEAQVRGGTLYSFLQEKFCRISASTASGFCEAIGVTSRTKALEIEPPQVEALFKVFQEARLAPPPTDCLAPIGVRQLLAGMLKGVKAEFYAASSRAPEVYRGRPFQIEAAIAFGGELAGDDSARVIRFANRVPLLYQQSACSAFKAVAETGWRNYQLSQPRGGAPQGPLVILIHMASVWVPFTSESKEAIADYDEIRKEMKLALMECGRKLGIYLRRRQRMKREAEKRDVFERYIGEIARSCEALTGTAAKDVYDALLEQARRKTDFADAELDDEGNVIKEETGGNGRLDGDEGVVILGTPPPRGPGGTGDKGGSGRSVPTERTRAAMEKVASMQFGGEDDERVTAHDRVEKEVLREGAARAAETSDRAAGGPKRAKGAVEPPRGAIKNKGKPKPRVRLGTGGLFAGAE